MGNLHRGVRGLELRWTDRVERVCSTELVAKNRRFSTLEDRFKQRHGLDAGRYLDQVKARRFSAHQLLFSLGERPQVTPMVRGNTVVPMAQVHRASTVALAQGMGDWMLNQLHADGRMTYKYWPSRGEETPSNNMIRQFMASVALVRLAAYRGDAAIEARALQNLRYNFSRFYFEDGDVGHIAYAGKSKLGAAALAALAIVEAPFRSEFAAIERGLRALCRQLQRPDGSFQTFYRSKRDDNQNF